MRPLTVGELCHALAINSDDGEACNRAFNEENVPDVKDILSVCAGLITVDKESNIVRLVHYTAQEYLALTRKDFLSHAQLEISRACLVYLSYDEFRKGSCATDVEFEKRMRRYKLLDYACRHWGEHARFVQRVLFGLTKRYIEDPGLIDSSMQVMTAIRLKFSNHCNFFIQRSTGIHMLAKFGLHILLELFLFGDQPTPIQPSDQQEVTNSVSLPNLAEHRIISAKARKLLVLGTSPDSDGKTPLFYAAESGHKAAVAILLKIPGIVKHRFDLCGRTPLWYACQNRHSNVIDLFLGQNTSLGSAAKSNFKGLLFWSAKEGHHRVFNELLLRHIPADSKDKNGRTALWWAAAAGHEKVVKQLLKRPDVCVDCKDKKKRTPLTVALLNRHLAVARLLIQRSDVSVNHTILVPQSYEHATLLWWAASVGFLEAVELLLGREDIEANRRGENGYTPLEMARSGGYETIVRILMKRKDVQTTHEINRALRDSLERSESTRLTLYRSFYPYKYSNNLIGL